MKIITETATLRFADLNTGDVFKRLTGERGYCMKISKPLQGCNTVALTNGESHNTEDSQTVMRLHATLTVSEGS